MPDDPPAAMLRTNTRSRISASATQYLIPDCVIEEVHDDKAQITTHPVEQGMNISDHAFMLPKQLEMRVAWSDYKNPSPGTQHSRFAYEELMRLQSRLEPLTVDNLRRNYKNMLIESITVTVDQKTMSGVLAVVRFREVRQANVRENIQANETPIKTGTTPPATSQTTPQSTQPVRDQGTQTPPQTGVTTTPPPPGSPPDSAAVVGSDPPPTTPTPPPSQTTPGS